MGDGYAAPGGVIRRGFSLPPSFITAAISAGAMLASVVKDLDERFPETALIGGRWRCHIVDL